MTRRPETDIARAVVAWLQAQGWTVYQEVPHLDRVAGRDLRVWTRESAA